MKLTRFVWSRFWQVHAWAGVSTSLVVYFMFLLGGVTLFYEPLTVWEEPLLQRAETHVPSFQALLTLAGSVPEEFYIYLPEPTRPLPKLSYFAPGTTEWRSYWFDFEHNQMIPQREMAAARIYDLHYLWHDVTGYALQYGAGVLVFGFLLALVSGVLIQLKNLSRQLNQFRPQRGTRVLFSDLHKVLGVFGLPFQLMYALTGSMMVLAPLLFELSVKPVFGGDTLRASDVAGALVDELPPREMGARIVSLPLDALVAQALAREPRLHPESLVFRNYPFEVGTVDVRGHVQGQPFGDGMVRVRVRDGQVELVQTPDHETSVSTLARWLHEAHTVQYGGPGVRLCLVFLAFGGCITILTGNWIWLTRRKPSPGNTLLARLTAGVGAGTPVALAAMLLVSRVLPLDWPPRLLAEQLVLGGSLVACIVWGLLRRDTLAVWWQQLLAAACLLAATPLCAARLSARGLFGAADALGPVLWVDVSMLLLSAALCATAWWLRARAMRVRASAPHAVLQAATS
jgi:uncharacterized iron-regulated membrane protein